MRSPTKSATGFRLLLLAAPVSGKLLSKPLVLLSRSDTGSPAVGGLSAALLLSVVALSNLSMIRIAWRARSIGVAMPQKRPPVKDLQKVFWPRPTVFVSSTPGMHDKPNVTRYHLLLARKSLSDVPFS